MNITLHSKGIALLPKEKKYAEEQAQKLINRAKIFKGEESLKIKIEIDKEALKIHKEQFFCAFTISIPHKNIRAEAHSGGIYSAIDDAFVLVDQQLHKEKEKHRKALERKKTDARDNEIL